MDDWERLIIDRMYEIVDACVKRVQDGYPCEWYKLDKDIVAFEAICVIVERGELSEEGRVRVKKLVRLVLGTEVLNNTRFAMVTQKLAKEEKLFVKGD